MQYDPERDEIIQALIAEAEADPDVLGLVLSGSRAIGAVSPESDYDAIFVVTDEALARYKQSQSAPERGATVRTATSTCDLWHESPGTLQMDKVEWWMRPAYAEARVLYDRTGETTHLVDNLRWIPAEKMRSEVEYWYDAYLNGLYRSLKAWRRGNELGGRLEAAESANYLVNLLFALERRWRPYSSRLIFHLEHLAGQGWQAGELPGILLDLIGAGSPRRQQVVAHRVVALLHERGFGHIYDSWDGQIDQVLAWAFPE